VAGDGKINDEMKLHSVGPKNEEIEENESGLLLTTLCCKKMCKNLHHILSLFQIV